MIKVGIESDAYFRYKNERIGIAEARQDGYDCLDYQDICVENSPIMQLSNNEYEMYLKNLKNIADNEGIEFNQAHGLWPKDDTTKQSRDKNIDLYVKQIKGCYYLGTENLVIHSVQPDGWEKEKDEKLTFDENVKLLEKLSLVGKDYNVNVCLENLPFYGFSLSKTKAVKEVVDAVDKDNVKICFDVGHANVMQENIYDSVLTAGKKLEVLHVHDNYGTRDDRHYVPFQGNIDWDGFIKGLNKIEFKGCMSLETVISVNTPKPMLNTMRKGLAGIAKYLAKRVK